MARQSAAALAVVRPRMLRAEPPAELSAVEASFWRAVVETKPPEWFLPDTYPLLLAYCRARSASEIIAQQLAAFEPAWMETPEGLARYDKLTQIQARQTMLLTTLATKMRLAQQSRYTETAANTAAKHGLAGTKPWQRAKEA